MCGSAKKNHVSNSIPHGMEWEGVKYPKEVLLGIE